MSNYLLRVVLVRFNPCCLGLAVLASNCPGGYHEVDGFNPCCLGLAVLAFPFKDLRQHPLCFNPCCLGLAVLAPWERTDCAR